MTTAPHYKLGLPAWAFPAWKDRYFCHLPSPLASYAQVFNTVEGNTTFYHTPARDTVASWREAVTGTALEICFKLPRQVTHERHPDLAELKRFFNHIAPLEHHIGPILLQFPARIGPQHLPALKQFCAQLPRELQYVLEVRHTGFFNDPLVLEPLLEKFQLGRVSMDTRALFQGNRQHPELVNALHDKPDLPVLAHSYNNIVFTRLMLHPDIISNESILFDYANKTANQLSNGQRVYMMIHCPNNAHCPALAEFFHKALQQRLGRQSLADLPAWPVPTQNSLF